MIKQIPNVFPLELIDQIHDQIISTGWKYGWKSNPGINFSHWNQQHADHTILENSLDMSEKLVGVYKEAWGYLNQTYFPDRILLRCYSNAHTFGVEGYPHADSKRLHDTTLVVYLNKNWKREWGGETIVYLNDRIGHAELPGYNQGLEFFGYQTHCAKSVARICPDLRMTLMFKMAPKDIDPIRDFVQTTLLELGADKIAHGKRKLINHLLNVYDLLKWCDRNQSTCLGGAFHSIFGTNIFKHKTLTSDDQSLLAAKIGSEATQLAIIFSQLKRPTTLEHGLKDNSYTLDTIDNDKITVSREQFYSLVAIEAANLHEQSSLDDRVPTIKSYWNTIYHPNPRSN